jgi:hypothetical protein
MQLALLTPCHDGMYHSNYNDLLLAAARRSDFIYAKSEYESDIVRHRSKMASHFLTAPVFANCWGTLTVDADIGARAPAAVLTRILSLPEDIDIVCGVYTKKNGHPAPVLRGLTEERHPADPNIVRAECVPTGFSRVSRRCLQAVYDSKYVSGCRDAWRLVYHARIMASSLGLGYETEDYAFCLDAAALGFKVWVDRSIRLSHRGAMEYRADAVA